MDNKLSFPLGLEEPTDVDAAIQECFAEVDRALAQIQRHQAEIDTLKAETRLLNEQTQAMLVELKRAAWQCSNKPMISPIWSPYDAHEAAATLMQLLEQDKAEAI